MQMLTLSFGFKRGILLILIAMSCNVALAQVLFKERKLTVPTKDGLCGNSADAMPTFCLGEKRASSTLSGGGSIPVRMSGSGLTAANPSMGLNVREKIIPFDVVSQGVTVSTAKFELRIVAFEAEFNNVGVQGDFGLVMTSPWPYINLGTGDGNKRTVNFNSEKMRATSSGDLSGFYWLSRASSPRANFDVTITRVIYEISYKSGVLPNGLHNANVPIPAGIFRFVSCNSAWSCINSGLYEASSGGGQTLPVTIAVENDLTVQFASTEMIITPERNDWKAYQRLIAQPMQSPPLRSTALRFSVDTSGPFSVTLTTCSRRGEWTNYCGIFLEGLPGREGITMGYKIYLPDTEGAGSSAQNLSEVGEKINVFPKEFGRIEGAVVAGSDFRNSNRTDYLANWGEYALRRILADGGVVMRGTVTFLFEPLVR
jgi:hypothetical protein